MAQLAIRGHATRGSEVIELLKMLGADRLGYKDTFVGFYYYIECGVIVSSDECPIDAIVFTLEEFEEKFPYKVGDKVSSKYLKNRIIEKAEWESCNNRIIYKLKGMGWYNTKELQSYKEKNMEERKYADLRLDVDQDDKLATEVAIDGDKITPPKNYLIGKITKVDHGMLVEFVKKQPQYPNTYRKCCEILGIEEDLWFVYEDIDGNHINPACISNYRMRKLDLYHNFEKLRVCRDAYWKVYGEYMGLRKLWEPDWKDNSDKYFICYLKDELWMSNVRDCNRFLVFPTEGIRDTFFENFKDLIEQCKELL